ncbi:2-dehydro-3-deoxyphosphooctonate aldolase [Folsomia candida]|uniref:2-dehydro-3-deoxyphosphooctonate aldolase n=1 Tax=Folsomia candida TaxID=158441 RepID=A0A226E9W7_FOLCA|nr:2-dehydro-3-deoxyphosphooctonate aldolase [Folsomia candida]
MTSENIFQAFTYVQKLSDRISIHPLRWEGSKHQAPTSTRHAPCRSLYLMSGPIYLGGLYLYGQGMAEILNTVISLEKQLLKFTFAWKSPFDKANFANRMILCARIATILPPILSVSAILTRIDPYYTVINVLLPPKFIASLSIKLFLTLLRLILMFCIILELCRAAYILFVVVIFFALVLSNVLRLLEQYYAGLPAFKILEAKQYILFYQEICVLIFATNLALSLICFASLTIGFGMFIVSGVILIKLWRRAPILNLVICLILILGGVYFLLVQFPRAAEVHSATERMKKPKLSTRQGLVPEKLLGKWLPYGNYFPDRDRVPAQLRNVTIECGGYTLFRQDADQQNFSIKLEYNTVEKNLHTERFGENVVYPSPLAHWKRFIKNGDPSFGFDMTQDFGKGLWIPVHQPRSCWETANQDNSKNKKVPNWFIVPEAVE